MENQSGIELAHAANKHFDIAVKGDARNRSNSPCFIGLEKLKEELQELRKCWQSRYQTKDSCMSHYPVYNQDKNPVHAMISKESAKESLYNFDSYLHKFIESSAKFNQKTNDVMSSLFEDDDNFYEKCLTKETQYFNVDEKLISPVDYPFKSKKTQSKSDDILKLQVMLSDVFGDDKHTAPCESPDKTPLKDMIFSSPNIGLPGLDCSFTITFGENRKIRGEHTIHENDSCDCNLWQLNCSDDRLIKSENIPIDFAPGQQDGRPSILHLSEGKKTEEGISGRDDYSNVAREEMSSKLADQIHEIEGKSEQLHDCQSPHANDVKPSEVIIIEEILQPSLTNEAEEISIKDVLRQNKELRRSKTKFGFTFQDCTKLYQQNQFPKSCGVGRHVDFIACDTSCYDDFQKVLKPILCKLHYGKELRGKTYELQKKTLRKMCDGRCHSNVLECVLEIRRSFKDSVFPIACKNPKQKQRDERLLRAACKTAFERFKGQTVPLSYADENIRELFRQDILAHEMDTSAPCHSSVYKSVDGNVLVLLNFKEHVHIITKCPQMDLKKLFADGDHILTKIEQHLKVKGHSFAWDKNLGYLNPDPSNLGMALRLTVRMTLPNLDKICSLDKILDEYGAEISRKVYDNNVNEYIYNLRNRYQFGVSELDVVSMMISVTHLLCEIDARIESDQCYEDLLEKK